MPSSAASRARSSRASSDAASSCAPPGSSPSPATSARRTTPSTARSPSSASWSTSSPRGRLSRSSSREKERSRRAARRSARPIPRIQSRAPCAATSRSRCRTTSCTAATRPSRPSARSGSGSRMDWRNDAARNAELWTTYNGEYTDANAAVNWALDDISWGIWGIDESELNVLGDVSGLDVVELGCGTAYFSAWLAKRGARPTGVDITPAQLATARRLMAETGIEFPLIEADAAQTGLPDACADLVVSEYGASIWVDPYRWVPEAARLLRPGGRLVFLRNSTLVILCSTDEVPAGECLVHPQFGMHRFEWPEGGVEFHLAHGEWIDLLRANEFEIERLIELQAPPDAQTHTRYDYVTAEWAKKWPCEEIWVARLRRS